MFLHKRIKIISVISATTIVASVAFFWFNHGEEGESMQASLWNLFSENRSEGEPDAETSAAAVEGINSEMELYLDSEYRFSFEYPASYTVQPMDEEIGETLLVQGPGEKNTFQIFITPFDEDLLVMTPDRIHQDLPNIVIKNPQEIVLSNDNPSSAPPSHEASEGQGGATAGKHALMFLSYDPTVGDTREVWIIDSGYLYQISSYAEFDAQLARIMQSFKFGANSSE